MENIIETRKVNRSLFAWRVVDVHNDEFGFAQDNVIYTYATDTKSKTKGVTWLRMQKTGETGQNRRKYFLFFADETEASAYVDKHNDIYDLEGNYVASLIRSRFIIFLVIFIAAVMFFTGLAIYLGGSMIMDTSSPFSEDKTIHMEANDTTDGKGSAEEDIDIFAPDEKKEKEPANPINDVIKDIKDDKKDGKDNDDVVLDDLSKEKEDAIAKIKEAAEKAKKAIDESSDLSDEQKKDLKAEIDNEATDAISNIEEADTVKDIENALNDGLDAIADTLDDAVAWEFVNKYCAEEKGNPYDKKNDLVTKSNADQIIDGEDAYDRLTDSQRKKVNKIIFTPTNDEKNSGYDKYEDNYKTYPEMLRDAKSKKGSASGKLTDKTKATEKLIWPGISDEFVFYVENDGDTALNYQISFSEDNENGVPLNFKILVNDEYVLGDENTWASSANYSAPNTPIAPGDIVQYKIVWEWPFDVSDSADKHDTEIGANAAQGVSATYSIHTTVYFEEVV